MQKEIEDLKREDISKQLDKLVLGSVGNYETESETNSESGSSSFGDETDAFDESLENDLGKAGWNTEEEEALSLESEEASLNEEAESEQSDDLMDEPVGLAEQPGSSTRQASFQKEDEYILKLKEIQDEVNNLKEMIEEFGRDIKSSLTEIIFDQFSQLESELFADETAKSETENGPAKEESTGGDEMS